VTGDRDLFQLVDDARDVRVVYTAKGMSNLEVVTDEIVVKKYGVHGAQYADFAVMRGDASDGLPGVAGVGEKTAATLLQNHGDLAGILAAAEAGDGMSAGVQAKLRAAADYLAVAPAVVEVARSLDLGSPADRIVAADDPARTAAEALAERWSLGGAMTRALDALAAAAAADD
jgi:5'-3' exonuclease